MKTIIATLASALLLFAVPAQATGLFECEAVAKAEWLTEDQLKAQLISQGWQVRLIKPDGGCWEVYGTTPEGLKVEGYFHPKTGEKLMLNQRGKVIFKKE